MARPLRLEFPGAVYHVTSRGARRAFRDDQDRDEFLDVLQGVVARYRWRCYAYCVMDRDYELLIETPDGNLSKGMRQLNGIYTQRFNARHRRSGPVFQGRYRSIVIEPAAYLQALCVHVVLNPVRAGVAASADRYKWSSYRATAGRANPPPFLDVDGLLSRYAKRQTTAQQRYRDDVRQGMKAPSPWEQRSNQILLGGPAFVAKLKPFLDKYKGLDELPKRRRLATRPTLRKFFAGVRGASKVTRNRLIRKAHVDYGYTLSEIGDHLGLHYSTISKVVNSP